MTRKPRQPPEAALEPPEATPEEVMREIARAAVLRARGGDQEAPLTRFDEMMIELALEVGPFGCPSLYQWGVFVKRYPALDVDIIELAAAGHPGEWRDLRDLVIYGDGKCLFPEVEHRRLTAAKRGLKRAPKRSSAPHR